LLSFSPKLNTKINFNSLSETNVKACKEGGGRRASKPVIAAIKTEYFQKIKTANLVLDSEKTEKSSTLFLKIFKQ